MIHVIVNVWLRVEHWICTHEQYTMRALCNAEDKISNCNTCEDTTGLLSHAYICTCEETTLFFCVLVCG